MSREAFENYIRSVPFFAYCEGDALERDAADGGYLDAVVHAAWLGWNKNPAKTIPDGGSAFPYIETGDCGVRPGASLRDYFAAHCGKVGSVNQVTGERLAGRPMPDLETDTVAWFEFWFEVEARLSYLRADAFVKVRTGT